MKKKKQCERMITCWEGMPKRCPVCNGSGQVMQSLYNLPASGLGWIECRSCNGKGYIILPKDQINGDKNKD